jgi:hypothetical protein
MQRVPGWYDDLKRVQLEMNQRAFVAQEGKMAFDGFADEEER